MDKEYYVYMLASGYYGTLYIGVTGDLLHRVHQHRTSEVPGFTAKYKVDRLVWYEVHRYVNDAITREKHLKKWRRAWKIDLINRSNPRWDDLYEPLASG